MGDTEKEEIIKKCADMLGDMVDDITVPRNIKKAMGVVKIKLLNGDESLALRAAAGISDLEVLTTNPNIPSHARTVVWSIITQLETVSVED